MRELTARYPDPLAGFKGPTSTGKDGEEGREGTAREGRDLLLRRGGTEAEERGGSAQT